MYTIYIYNEMKSENKIIFFFHHLFIDNYTYITKRYKYIHYTYYRIGDVILGIYI